MFNFIIEIISEQLFCRIFSLTTSRSSRLEVFCKIQFLKAFGKFTGKHQWQITIVVTGFSHVTLLK